MFYRLIRRAFSHTQTAFYFHRSLFILKRLLIKIFKKQDYKRVFDFIDDTTVVATHEACMKPLLNLLTGYIVIESFCA